MCTILVHLTLCNTLLDKKHTLYFKKDVSWQPSASLLRSMYKDMVLWSFIYLFAKNTLLAFGKQCGVMLIG